MADAPCHIINSTRFNVTLSQDVDEISASSQLADFFHRTVQPALDKALSGYAAGDHDYRIDRLAIDLGTIDIFHPDSDIAEKIRLCLARALQGLEPQQIQPAKPQQRVRESFLAFLQTGQFPWFGAEMTISDLENKIKELVERDIEQMLESMQPLLRGAVIRRRLLQQFSLFFIDWLVEKMQPDLTAAFFEKTLKFRFEPSAVDRAEILLRVAARVQRESSKRVLREEVLIQIDEFLEKKQSRGRVEDQPGIAETALDSAGEEHCEELTESERSFFVNQAGVVLLHPFLPRLLDRRGLLDAGQEFKDARCREKAVHLLHFLATGHEHPEEPQTGVYKILCGLDIVAPVQKILDLEPEDRNEAVRLLGSAIEHWSRLKKTSPDGLRTSFLQRQGKLTHTRDGWRLTVEQHAIDILLGTLPWNLSVIRLPWLRQPVWVDWA